VQPVALEGVGVQQFVVDADDRPAPGREVASPGDALGGGGGGLVERRGGGRPPVQEQLVLGVIGEPEPADVASPAVREVEAAEDEPVLDRGEPGDPLAVPGVEGVALGAAGGSGDDGGTPDVVERRRGTGPQRVQLPVQLADVCLLDVEFVLQILGRQGRASFCPSPALLGRPSSMGAGACGCTTGVAEDLSPSPDQPLQLRGGRPTGRAAVSRRSPGGRPGLSGRRTAMNVSGVGATPPPPPLPPVAPVRAATPPARSDGRPSGEPGRPARHHGSDEPTPERPEAPPLRMLTVTEMRIMLGQLPVSAGREAEHPAGPTDPTAAG
jgi:hypothetical protein